MRGAEVRLLGPVSYGPRIGSRARACRQRTILARPSLWTRQAVPS